MPRRNLGVAATRLANLNAAWSVEASPAVDPVDLVLTEKKLDPVPKSVDAGLLLIHHRDEVEFRIHLDAEAVEFGSGQIEQLRSVKQGFRGDAADVEAGAAEYGIPFDAG